MRRYSYEASDEASKAFHEDLTKAISQVRGLLDRCSKAPSDDLAVMQRKRKQRSLVDHAVRSLEGAARLIENAADPNRKDPSMYPVLTKKSLTEACKSIGNLQKVASHFGMEPNVVKRMIRMFGITVGNSEQFYGGAA